MNTVDKVVYISDVHKDYTGRVGMIFDIDIGDLVEITTKEDTNNIYKGEVMNLWIAHSK